MQSRTVNLAELAEEVSGEDGEANLVTRQTGKQLRRRLEDLLDQAEEPTVFVVSFSDVGIVDYSCADEVFAKTAGRMVQGEYEESYMLLDEMSDSHYENVDVALEQKKLCLIGRRAEREEFEELGKIDRYLKDVLELINERGQLTARELSETFDLEHNTASTRLGNLYNARLVVRDHGAVDEGGRMYIYQTLPSIVDRA